MSVSTRMSSMPTIKRFFKNSIRSLKRNGSKYQYPYVRYIILGNPRTGSNMLRGLLNQNKHAVAFGELFRFNDSIGWDYPGHDHKASCDLLLINQDPVQFLKTKVFIQFPPEIKAVGFKMFYFHATVGDWRCVWPYLEQERDFKIIHIKRKNILKMFLSHTRALHTDKWVNTIGKPEEQHPIELEYDKCLHYFEKVKAYERDYSSRFKYHQQMELIYEDLVNDRSKQFKGVTDFLGIPFVDVEPVTFQQAVKPLSESIANYSRLKEQFKNSPWAEFFEV